MDTPTEAAPEAQAINHLISQQIRVEMARAGLNQSQLSTRLGRLSRAGINERLSNKIRWSVADLVGLARVFDVPLIRLLPEDLLMVPADPITIPTEDPS